MPGMEVPVKIDPKNEMNIAIDFSGGAHSSGQPQNAAMLQGELEQMQKTMRLLVYQANLQELSLKNIPGWGIMSMGIIHM